MIELVKVGAISSKQDDSLFKFYWMNQGRFKVVNYSALVQPLNHYSFVFGIPTTFTKKFLQFHDKKFSNSESEISIKQHQLATKQKMTFLVKE